MMDDKHLKECQKASQEVEVKMIERLLGFIPAQELKVSDMLYIAREARAIAFESFYTKPE
jgi:hypothetical protein